MPKVSWKDRLQTFREVSWKDRLRDAMTFETNLPREPDYARLKGGSIPGYWFERCAREIEKAKKDGGFGVNAPDVRVFSDKTSGVVSGRLFTAAQTAVGCLANDAHFHRLAQEMLDALEVVDPSEVSYFDKLRVYGMEVFAPIFDGYRQFEESGYNGGGSWWVT